MRSHRLLQSNLNAVCLWSDLSPCPSTLEIVANVEGGIILNNKTLYKYKTNNDIYRKFYAKPVKTNDGLSDCKVVLFWNNPYYRILSEYLINYVFCRTITEPSISFASYIETKTEDLHQHEILQIKNWILTNINQKIEQIKIYVALLPNSIFSNLSLCYDDLVVEKLYKFLWRSVAYKRVKHLFKSSYIKSDSQDTNVKKLDLLMPNDLLSLLTEHGQDYFESQTFFSTDVINKINSLIEDELHFFKTIQVSFNL